MASELSILIKRINTMLAERGIKKMQFYREIGISAASYSAWKEETAAPSFSMLLKLSDYFSVPLSSLFGENGETEKAPDMEPEAVEMWGDFCALDDRDQRIVRAMMREMGSKPEAKQEPPRTKVIPLLGQRFAAGRGEPDNGMPWEDHAVPENSPADFAVRVSGNSMEPYLHDGSIALAKKGLPSDGEVGVFLVDGNFIVKQVCEDYAGTLHLFSLNRDRADADEHIPKDIDRDVRCFGTVLMDKKIPLPGKGGRKL